MLFSKIIVILTKTSSKWSIWPKKGQNLVPQSSKCYVIRAKIAASWSLISSVMGAEIYASEG